MLHIAHWLLVFKTWEFRILTKSQPPYKARSATTQLKQGSVYQQRPSESLKVQPLRAMSGKPWN